MASTAAQIAEDEAAVAKQREMFGDAAAAQLAADLYKIRRTPDNSLMGRFPRGLVVLIAIWIGLLETADKLPRLLLAYPGYEATLAEFQAKMLQPDLTQAQLDRARLEAKAAEFAPDTAAAQRDKLQRDALAATFGADSASAALDKARADARAAKWQPSLLIAQRLAAQAQWMAGGPDDNWRKSENLKMLSESPDFADYRSPGPQPTLVPKPGPTPTPTISLEPKEQLAAASPHPVLATASPSTPAPSPTPSPHEVARTDTALNLSKATPTPQATLSQMEISLQRAEASLSQTMDEEIKSLRHEGRKTWIAMIDVAFRAILARKFEMAINEIDRAEIIFPNEVEFPDAKRAHALMFLNRAEEARQIYYKDVGIWAEGKSWKATILQDFKEMRAAGLDNPLMTEIENRYNRE